MLKLQFKFRDKAVEAARKQVISALSKHGAKSVRRLFQNETDEELASLYIVDCQDESSGREILNLLKASPAVEFAEGEVRRKLIR
jgi:hypothetical protein